MDKNQLVMSLKKIDSVKFGSFTLKSGIQSPFYIDLRNIVSYPDVLESIVDSIIDKIKVLEFDVITGIPYTALPIASIIASKLKIPLIYIRKEKKDYGAGGKIVGHYKKCDRCLVIDDVITTGGSKLETAEELEASGVEVKDFVVIIDRSFEGKKIMKDNGYKLHSLFNIRELLDMLRLNDVINENQVEEVLNFINK
ncbi:orotate phosphoribosyltransferase [bacterium]|nr:orotate phosphoribosyltransferase [bacterium]